MKFTKEKYGYKGSKSAYTGIRKYLDQNYNYPYTVKGGEKRVKLLMLRFLKANDTKWREGFKNQDAHYNARRIQANFQTFALWLKTQYPNHDT